MQDVKFHSLTLDLQPLSEEEFGKELWKIPTHPDGINLVILEGREKPSSISDSYIQVVPPNINRFARTRQVPLLFVIPTIEEQVARNWCEHGSRVGDLIPEQKLYDGSRWYNFPGVPKSEYIAVVEETVRTLNPPRSLYDFGVSSEEVTGWVETAPTIGRFIEILANQIIQQERSFDGIGEWKTRPSLMIVAPMSVTTIILISYWMVFLKTKRCVCRQPS